MAEPSNDIDRAGGRISSPVGHFYYDWVLSKYRWTPDAVDGKADPSNVKKAVRNNANCPAPVGNSGMRKDVDDKDTKKPLQDRDINQLLQKPEVYPVKQSANEDVDRMSKQGKTPSGKECALDTSDETYEIMKGHKTMVTVLSARLLRLRAAKTLWHKNLFASSLKFDLYECHRQFSYPDATRLQDDSILVDVIPFLTKRVRDQSIEGQSLSMGACLEMLPALERLLSSRFEDYVIAALNMIREMIKRWWTQLKSVTSKHLNSSCYRYSRSVNGLYMAMVSVSAIIVKLAKRRGRVGEKAEVVAKLLDLL